MSDTSTTGAPFEVRLPEPALSKGEREYRAFLRLLPGLLATHRGQFVAIHEGRVVDSGPERVEVAYRVQQRLGPVPIHVALVSDEPERVYRSGVIRALKEQGTNA
jgi:hypothetical protein